MKLMPKPTALLASAALALAVAGPLRAQDDTPAPVDADTVVATVNGEDITIGHVIAARFAMPEQFQSLPNEVLFEALVEQLIQQTVLGQAMGEMTRRAQIQLENERRSIYAADHLVKMVEEAVTEEAIAAAYEKSYADAEPTQEWNASHILVETEEEAEALVKELEGGADFAELAKEKSTGPSGPGGGELGWFGPGMMVAPFEEAVSGMEVGAISAPVQTQFGWHVVKLNDERMKGAPTLDEVRDEIVESLETDAVEQALKTLLGAADIERADIKAFDPEVIGDMSLLD